VSDNTETFKAVGIGNDIPVTAKTAIQFAMWVCEQEGFKFTSGSTACYWSLLGTLAQHMKMEES